MRHLLKRAETGFVVLALLLSTEPFFLFLSQSTRQSIWSIAYVIIFILLIPRRQLAIINSSKAPLLWIFLLFIVLSFAWSDDPTTTLRQSIAFVGSALFGVYLSTYPLKDQLKFLAWAFYIAIILSFIFVIILPAYGLQGGSAWQGIYHQKNLLGRIMVLSTFVFLFYGNSIQRKCWMPWIGIVLSGILLLFSDSKTSLGVYIILLLCLPIYKTLRTYYKLAVPIFAAQILISGAAATILLSSLEATLASQGKDLTFTGRTRLWELVIDMINQRPWLGYGLGAFWRGWEGASARIWSVEVWLPKHAHNGFLEICLNLGFIGLIIFLIGTFWLLRKVVIQASKTRTSEYFFPPTFLLFLLLYNLSESTFILSNSIYWILYVAAFCSSQKQSNSIVSSLHPQKLSRVKFHNA